MKTKWILLRNIHQSSALQYIGFCFATSIIAPLCNTLDFASQHPSKLRFDNTKNKKHSSELGVFFILVFIRDLD